MDELTRKLVRMVAKQAGISEKEAASVVEEIFSQTSTSVLLKELRDKRDNGLISETEYQAKRAKLLASQ